MAAADVEAVKGVDAEAGVAGGGGGRWRRRLAAMRSSTRLQVALVYAALLLDNVLLTVVVPILPDYLHSVDLIMATSSIVEQAQGGRPAEAMSSTPGSPLFNCSRRHDTTRLPRINGSKTALVTDAVSDTDTNVNMMGVGGIGSGKFVTSDVGIGSDSGDGNVGIGRNTGTGKLNVGGGVAIGGSADIGGGGNGEGGGVSRDVAGNGYSGSDGGGNGGDGVGGCTVVDGGSGAVIRPRGVGGNSGGVGDSDDGAGAAVSGGNDIKTGADIIGGVRCVSGVGSCSDGGKDALGTVVSRTVGGDRGYGGSTGRRIKSGSRSGGGGYGGGDAGGSGHGGGIFRINEGGGGYRGARVTGILSDGDRRVNSGGIGHSNKGSGGGRDGGDGSGGSSSRGGRGGGGGSGITDGAGGRSTADVGHSIKDGGGGVSGRGGSGGSGSGGCGSDISDGGGGRGSADVGHSIKGGGSGGGGSGGISGVGGSDTGGGSGDAGDGGGVGASGVSSGGVGVSGVGGGGVGASGVGGGGVGASGVGGGGVGANGVGGGGVGASGVSGDGVGANGVGGGGVGASGVGGDGVGASGVGGAGGVAGGGGVWESEGARVGVLLASKALVQLLCNPLAGLVTARLGGRLPQLLGSAALLAAALAFAAGQRFAALLLARSLQGAASACIGVSGMSVVAELYAGEGQAGARSRVMGAVLGAGAAGVLLGYPLGGALYQLADSKAAPFLLLAAPLAMLTVMQLACLSLKIQPADEKVPTGWCHLLGDRKVLIAAGAILVSTSSMAILEPCLPIWLLDTIKPQKWQLGTVFFPDSLGYLLGTNCFGLFAYKIGPWKVALAALILVGISSICVPAAGSLSALALPHLGLGLGIGVADAALVPLLAALVHSAHYGSVYSLEQTAVSLAYFLGPFAGGELVEAVGFPWLMRIVGLLNILYCPLLFLVILKDNKQIREGAITDSSPWIKDYQSNARTDQSKNIAYKKFIDTSDSE